MNALLLGCGSKWGLTVQQQLLAKDWTVYSLSSTEQTEQDNLHQHIIDWNTVNQSTVEKFLRSLPELDFVLFNQNGSALSYANFDQQVPIIDTWRLEKNWTQQYFVSVILPYHIIKTVSLNKDSRAAWMLSTFVYQHTNIDHADYIGNKYQNYLIMKNFSRTGDACFCGINPMELDQNQTSTGVFVDTILGMDTKELNSSVIYLDGNKDINFHNFSV
jgi:hypothetical protein